MRRIVGKGKKKDPPKTLEETSKAFDDRVGRMDGKAGEIDRKIKQVKMRMNKMPKGSAAYNAEKRRALQLLKQRKMYEKQGDMMRNQQFNIDQQQFQLDSMMATQEQVKTMAQTKKMMKKQMKKINIDKVQDLKDDLEDFMDENNEIQDILGENEMLNDLDEDELDAELEAFDEFDDALLDGADEQVPDYLQNDNLNTELPAAPNTELDAFGLPAAPVPVASEKKANAL